MSVLIKGIDMPISCADCFLEDAYEGYNCRIAQKSANWGLGDRPSWCPLVEAHEWIPVTERLPEEDGMYLVHGAWSATGRKVTDTCEFFVHDGYFRAAWNFDVTHWMPLPEPPKEES